MERFVVKFYLHYVLALYLKLNFNKDMILYCIQHLSDLIDLKYLGSLVAYSHLDEEEYCIDFK